jgi:hypothetical protein
MNESRIYAWSPVHPKALSLVVIRKGKTGYLSNQFGDLLSQVGLRENDPTRGPEEAEGLDENRLSSVFIVLGIQQSVS